MKSSGRPFRQKSTCVAQLTLGPCVVKIWQLEEIQSGLARVDTDSYSAAFADASTSAKKGPNLGVVHLGRST
jgi:hypothetical protein